MQNVKMGLMMLLICAVGLFTFDSYFGCVIGVTLLLGEKEIATTNLWEEALDELHKKIGIKTDATASEKGEGGGEKTETGGVQEKIKALTEKKKNNTHDLPDKEAVNTKVET